MRLYDALILGGGAAGLMAARVLKERGKRALVLEGRDRLGGRIWTKEGGPLPLERGAEFVHGEAPLTVKLCAEFGLTLVEPEGPHLWRRGRRWVEDDGPWAELTRCFARIAARKELSFFDHARGLPPRLKKTALRFVEGFHAADPREISALSLRQTPAEFEAAGRSRKILGGYGALIAGLSRVPSRLGEAIVSVSCGNGIVTVKSAKSTYRAKRAIVTLPLGVLQSAGIRFSPGLENVAALEARGMGHALRASFLLAAPAAPPAGFFHDPDGTYPVWWSSPLRNQFTLTAWRGGPRSRALAPHAITRARAQLARIFSPRVEILESVSHDWSGDKFSFGAYSYARVNKNLSKNNFSKKYFGALIFAGEHAFLDGESATVEGALRSGECAAKNIF